MSNHMLYNNAPHYAIKYGMQPQVDDFQSNTAHYKVVFPKYGPGLISLEGVQ